MARLQLWQYNGCIQTKVETSGQVGDQLQSDSDDSVCSSLLRVILEEDRATRIPVYSYLFKQNQVNRSNCFFSYAPGQTNIPKCIAHALLFRSTDARTKHVRKYQQTWSNNDITSQFTYASASPNSPVANTTHLVFLYKVFF